MSALHRRFWSKVSFARGARGCWLWTGARNEKGYGIFRGPDGKLVRAHRFAHSILVGEISRGDEVDHLCRNRLCIRCTESVPGSVNKLRAQAYAQLGVPSRVAS